MTDELTYGALQMTDHAKLAVLREAVERADALTATQAELIKTQSRLLKRTDERYRELESRYRELKKRLREMQDA